MTAFENTFESIIEPRAKRFPLKTFEQINRSIIEVVKMLFDLTRNLCFFGNKKRETAGILHKNTVIAFKIQIIASDRDLWFSLYFLY